MASPEAWNTPTIWPDSTCRAPIVATAMRAKSSAYSAIDAPCSSFKRCENSFIVVLSLRVHPVCYSASSCDGVTSLHTATRVPANREQAASAGLQRICHNRRELHRPTVLFDVGALTALRTTTAGFGGGLRVRATVWRRCGATPRDIIAAKLPARATIERRDHEDRMRLVGS
jgi:hypothetical protein